jgi:APA family basic amino acid/polyamine antiporter
VDNKNKSIGFWICFALIVGNMIGSGIFLLPANLAVYGGISIWGWLISVLGALALASVFGKLSKVIKRGGGPYAYTRVAFGDFAAFWIAWGYWISCWAAVAAIAIAFTGAMAIFLPALSENNFIGSIFAVACVSLLTAVNLLDIGKVGKLQFVTTLLKLIPLVLIGTLGFVYFEPSHFEPFNQSEESTRSAIASTATLTLWAFLGFESATIISHKVRNAEVTVPRATLYGTLFVAVVYILSCFAVMGIVPPEALQNSTAPFADAAGKIWGDWASYFIAAGTGIACFGAMNGWILIQAEIPHAAASDKLFPRQFERLSKNNVPYFGVLFSSALVVLLLLGTSHLGIVKQFEIIILLSTLTAVIPYCFCTMTEFSFLLKSRSKVALPIKELIITSAAFAFSIYAVLGAGEETVFSGFILLLLALPVFIWMKHKTAQGERDV